MAEADDGDLSDADIETGGGDGRAPARARGGNQRSSLSEPLLLDDPGHG